MDNSSDKVLELIDERLRALAVACADNYGAMKRLASLIHSVVEPYPSARQGCNSYGEVETTGTGSVVPLGGSVPTCEPSPIMSTQKEFFWPSKPQLPSMILKSSLSVQDVNYIPLETAMAREYLLLEYADAVKKVAMEIVDASQAAESEAFLKHERELAGVKADIPAYEQAAKQQGVNWCIKLLQRIADENDDKASRMIGYNAKSRAGNELREAIAKIRKEEQGMWADE